MAKEYVEKLSKNLLANEVIEEFKIISCRNYEFVVIVFPGSNCDKDVYNSINEVTGKKPKLIWYKDEIPRNSDLIILPGGFSFGDYLRQ